MTLYRPASAIVTFAMVDILLALELHVHFCIDTMDHIG